jgi:dTDP-4-amino-4,6-dideoxygalactose transaminase
MPIPVMRPRLPAAERLIHYLQKIDSTRIYSNHGPLSHALEERLERHFHLAPKTITAVANATLGLALALAAQAPRPGTLCVVPAWTFIATAHAVAMAGLVPYFVDVDDASGMLDPDGIGEEIARAPGLVSAVMPVASFGQPIDITAWDRFRSRTGLAVVIDAAASFDTLRVGETPAVVSLGATKVLGIGEGGFVASTNASLIRDVRTRANMGFQGVRQAIVAAVNAKMSEYHAAVGLASLDEWSAARSEWLAVAQAYCAALVESNQVQFQDGFGHGWISSTCILKLANSSAVQVGQQLAAAGIDTRRWWGDGAHAHPATAGYPRSRLAVTEACANAVIGVPFYRDLAAADVRHVANAILTAVSDAAPRQRAQ